MKFVTCCRLLFLVLTSQFCVLKAESVSIHIETQKDYEVLDHFFRMGILEEGYGYVLEGDKPISIRDFYSLDCFPIAKDLKYSEKEFANTLLVHEVIPIWNKLCSLQKNFVLKAVPLNTPESVELGWEVQFINIPKLQEVIDNNIDLFRYVLGPTLKSEQLVHKIAYSREMFSDVLQNDCVLIGIVLGFGSHNSLVGGRGETIQSLSFSRDMAPFAPKSVLMQSKKEHSLSFLKQETFACYYLDVAGGEDALIGFRSDFSLLKPSIGFSDIEEELLTLETANEPLPLCLRETQPVFIFSAYKGGPPNQPLFKHLERSQNQARTLLKKSDFLERVLEKIGGKKAHITCKKPASANLQLSFFHKNINAGMWNHIFDNVMRRFEDKEQQLAFIESFSSPPSSVIPPTMIGVSKATLEGLKKARKHLSEADAHFETLSKDISLQAIVPKQLFSKTTFASHGKELLKSSDRIRINYAIEDPKGNVLFANHDIWLSLSHTIPGFAHGVQGMRVGEKRLLFIHPSLAYGALTTIPPCLELVAKVQLLDFDEKSSGSLPSLTSWDLSWIQNPTLYHSIEESLQQQPRFIGSFYRDMLDKIEGPDRGKLYYPLTLKL